jgi:hypothetical protein
MKKLVNVMVLSFSLVLLMSNLALSQWTTTHVTDESGTEFDSRIVVDASGGVHMVFLARVGKGRKATSYKLFYTKKLTSGAFSTPVRVTNTSSGQDELDPDIVIDGQGLLHVVFRLEEDVDTYSLYYALFNGSAVWPTKFFDSSGSRLSIAVDGQGAPCIAFRFWDGTESDIFFSYDLSEPFNVTQSREPIGFNDSHPTIAIDNNGLVHLAYSHNTEPGLGSAVSYTHKQTPYSNSDDFIASVRATPLEDGVVYQLPRLAIDDLAVHIAYRRYEDFFAEPRGRTDCYYTRLDRNNLQTPSSLSDITRISFFTDVNLPDAIGPGIETSSNGLVHISWIGGFDAQGPSSYELYYATVDNGLVSPATPITVNNVRDSYPIMAMETDGTVHISYLEGGDVWYATNDGPPPTGTECFVEDIAMSLSYKGGKPSKRGWTATATVLIQDDLGNPVSGASVSGHWTGLTSDSDNGTTGSDGTDGRVWLDSDRINATGTFTFTVDNVSHPSLTYNPSLNVMDSNSISNMSKSATVTNEVTSLPSEFRLLQNYPNPFNPATDIPFHIPEATQVVVAIFNTRGQEIRRLADRNYAAGYHSLRWNGMDNQGNPVSSGVYLYQLRTATFSQLRKMSLLR